MAPSAARGWYHSHSRRRLDAPTVGACVLAVILLVILARPRRMDIRKSPCLQANLRDSDPDADRQCQAFLDLPLVLPRCEDTDLPSVPAIYHAIASSESPPPTVRANLLRSDGYRLNYHNDTTGYLYIRERCGREVAEAFKCFVPPAYRADIFRFCALTSEGGVYVDADIMLLAPLSHTYSRCAHATVGHDYPQGPSVAARVPGLQMKILAGRPKSPLFDCMVRSIVRNVRARHIPGPADGLSLTGPKLLADCYASCLAASNCTREGVRPPLEFQRDGELRKQPSSRSTEPVTRTSVAVTYRDTRQAAWPYAGLLGVDQDGREALLAFEVPTPTHFGYEAGTTHYSKLVGEGAIYTPDCELP